MTSDRDPFEVLAALFLPEERSTAAAVDAGPRHPSDAGVRPAAHASNGGPRSSSLSLAGAVEAPAAPERATVRPRRESLLHITAAVTGHLPVMAGLWATQFADRVGGSDGPTGLIRCERELVHAEILRAGGRHVGLRQGEDLHQWLARAARLVRRWVLCIPSSAEPGAALHPGFTDAVLLTSADEAAVAAARGVVEAIGAAARAQGRPCCLGMVIVGAPPERVQWMADELGSQAPRGVDLPLHGAIQRMDRVESSERYGFEAPSPPQIPDLLRVLEEAAHQAVDRLGGDGVDGGRRPPRAPMTPSAPSTAPSAPEATPIAAPAPAAAPSLPHALAAHVPGLTAVDLRCPVAPEVELATDASGRLHLVARAGAAESLRAARRWAEVNAPLLRRAFPLLGAGPLRLVERLVTADAVAVESLHGCGVALDLLIESKVGASTCWHCVPLNAAALSPEATS